MTPPEPGQALGETSPTMSETSQSTTSTDAAAATDAAATTDTATSTDAAVTTDAAPAFTWDGKVESLPADVQKIITDARADAGKARTTAKQQAADEARQEMADTVAKALGLVKDGEKVTPEQLAQQLATETDARSRTEAAHQALQREHQVLRSAITAGADHDALLDSRSFLAKVADLDPTAEDFSTKVDAAIAAALTDNPKLKAGRAPGASSVDHAGGSGEGAVTAEQFKNMSGAERNDLARRDPTLYARLSGRA